MNPVSSRPTAMLRLAAGSARALLWLLLTSWCLIAFSWGLLHWVIVPRIGNWKPELEQAATQALGLRVEIGALQAESVSLLPRLTLHDLRLFDPQGREALRLPSVLGTLSLRSLLSLGFEQLVIDRPELELRRRADGVVTLAGIALASRSGPSDAADWFFSQREFLLRDGLLRWSDELRPQAPPLELREVSLLVRNPGRQHQLRLDATPPADWGTRFSLRGRFRQPLLSLAGAGELKDWSGQLYGDFGELRLQPLRQYLDPGLLQQLELQDGEGSLAFWSELSRGQWTGFTGDLALRRLALRLAPDLKPLKLQQLSGRLELKQEAGALEIATHDLAFRTDQGATWPGGNLRYRETREPRETGGAMQTLQLEGDRLDLLALRQLAEQLPLPAQGRDWLSQLQPAGLIEQLELQWQAGPQPQGRWQAKGQVSGLSLQAGSDGRPGLSGANLDFDASDSGGQASLLLERGALDFPGLFEQPRLEFDRLQTELQWTVDGDSIKVEVPQLSFANADAAGQAKGRWQTRDPAGGTVNHMTRSRFPGRLELDATLSRADGTRVHRYLPLGVNAEARHYVRDAIRHGQSHSAQFKVRGDLADFPFSRPGSGEFSVRASVSGVELDYVPAMRNADGRAAWPALSQVDGELQIDGNSLAIVKGRAQVAELPQLRANQVEARIPDLAHAPQLQIKGQIAGPAADALAFVNRSPLLGLTGHALEQARIDGQTQVQLRLDLPLERIETSRVEGLVQFPGNDMQFTPDTPTLAGTSGSLRFSEQGFNVPQARTQLLGGELVFQGGMAPGKGAVVSFNGQGSASAAGLRTAPWDALTALGQIASGSTGYQVQLEFQGAATALTVSSNLQGLALALPTPLGKTAAESLPMRYEVAPQAPSNGRWRDLLSLDLGPAAKPVVSARYEREHEGEQTRVLRGALALGTERPALPARGVQAQFAFDRLSLEDWQDAFDVVQAAPGPVVPASGAVGTASPAGDSRAYWPGSVALRARQIDHEGRSFHELELKGQLERNSWRGTIAARQLKGRVEYQPADADSPGRVYARLEHLMLPHSAASEIEQLTQQAPVRLPALDIVVQDFELGSRKLGRLEIEAVNQQPSPAQREAGSVWRLEKLNLSSPEARLQATGHWAIAAAPRGVAGAAGVASAAVQRRTALQLKLEIEDAGALLARLGMPGVVRGGQGSLTGQVAWLGSPLALHPPSLNGTLQLALERGQFLQADPGLAKLLGVLSLQALPRRLTLDFRDIFSEGFAFDSVRGSARIAQGVISSDNLQMRGVNAV
ncbi:MAG: YhdP family protein, partial [Burkholderiales bacterium]|nr:YhdP family protein [Burkholderiales bacterium]